MTVARSHIVVRRKAKNGTDGADAPSTIYRGEYISSAYYYGNSYRCDIVKYNGTYYKARPDAPTSPFSGITPDNTNYWKEFGASYENIATGLLFAEEAVIEKAVIRKLRTAETGKRVVAQNNQLSVYDSSNNQRLNISGETIDVGSPTASYPLNYGAGVSESHYRSQGISGQSQQSFDICTFVVPSDSTQVIIPAIRIVASLSQYWYGGGITDMDGDISLVKSGSGVVATLKSVSYDSYGNIEYAGGTRTLSAGTYYIRVSMSFGWDVDPSTDYDSAIAISFENDSSGYVIVSSSTTQGIQIGANGITINLGNSFSAIFALDGTTPTMILQGINSSNQTIGLKITKSGGVQINRGSGWVSL